MQHLAAIAHEAKISATGETSSGRIPLTVVGGAVARQRGGGGLVICERTFVRAEITEYVYFWDFNNAMRSTSFSPGKW